MGDIEKIVATKDSEHGGTCDDCHLYLLPGMPVYKFASRRKEWAGLGGQGWWVCGDCAYKRTHAA